VEVKVTHRSNDVLASQEDAAQADPLELLERLCVTEANDIWACGVADAIRAALGDRHACVWLMRWAAWTLDDCCAALNIGRRMFYTLRAELDTWLKENVR
jgi:hypothetical protein